MPTTLALLPLLATTPAAVLAHATTLDSTSHVAFVTASPAEAHPGGVLLIVEDDSGLASPARPLYLASSLNAWNPADPDMRLEPAPDGTWRLHLPASRFPPGHRLEFKLTLGSWQTEELGAHGGVIPNRTLPDIDPGKVQPADPVEVRLRVPRFRDATPTPPRPFDPAQITGDVRTLRVTGGGGPDLADHQRDLLVWLPPGYDDTDNAERAYPLLLLMDGQHVFSTAGGAPAEWHADETATRLIASGEIEPCIIVGVPNAGNRRAQEYLPYPGIPDIDPAGDAFVAWLADTVLPALDAAYRLSPDPSRRCIGGASLGGTIAFYAATRRPDLFAMALVESLPLLDEHGTEPRRFLASVRTWPDKLVLGMGSVEAVADDPDHPRNAQYRDWLAELEAAARDAGLGEERLLVVLGEGQTHTERAWAERLRTWLAFLFHVEPRGE